MLRRPIAVSNPASVVPSTRRRGTVSARLPISRSGVRLDPGATSSPATLVSVRSRKPRSVTRSASMPSTASPASRSATAFPTPPTRRSSRRRTGARRLRAVPAGGNSFTSFRNRALGIVFGVVGERRYNRTYHESMNIATNLPPPEQSTILVNEWPSEPMPNVCRTATCRPPPARVVSMCTRGSQDCTNAAAAARTLSTMKRCTVATRVLPWVSGWERSQ